MKMRPLLLAAMVGMFTCWQSLPASSTVPMAPTQEPEEPAPVAEAFSNADAKLFADDGLFAALKAGVDAAQVQTISDPHLKALAAAILEGRYDAKNRRRTYEAYEPVESLAKRLKTGAYSQFENPTGIFFPAEKPAVVVVKGAGSQAVSLRVHDFGRKGADASYPLKDGVNIVQVRGRGLGYISYYTDNWRIAPAITVNIASGNVNGVFDLAVGTDADWPRLLAGAACEVVDLRGKYVHLVFPVQELKRFCPCEGTRLLKLYDTIIHTEQELMGLDKYKLQPKNHMFGRVVWYGYMHADGYGAAFHVDTMSELANPNKVPANSWGIAHEFGHVNQVRPGMCWVSTTEVTNNIYSSWVNYRLNPSAMRLEHEEIDGGEGGGNVAGGRFNAYLNAAIVHGEQWLCQKGPDKLEGYENGGDHFVKLCPLWQLQLYFGVAGRGNPDFYPDIFQAVRNTGENGMSNGRLQLNFMKNACDAAKQDLTGFFIQAGMLKPINKELDDYSRGRLTISQADCDALVAYAKCYPRPESDVICYISANSVEAYKNRAGVAGTTGTGVTGEGGMRTVSHAVWKNVAAFETYAGGKLVHIAMAGTGFRDNSATRVPYPAGATRIEAVAWDGKRTLVCGRR